ncbi:MAG: hypothetical protein AB1556_14305 [Bacillota bacterium]
MSGKMDYREVTGDNLMGGASPGELNHAYGLLEERYSCLRSNWDWFSKAGNVPGTPGCRMAAIIRRVEQN